uniref:Copper transport protein n=2 Tax=Amanita strobiliformis TaxID=67730 RepID=K4IPD1_9AGAR|nr:copper transport protein CTR3 [Amanita strobiliformis]
MNMGSGSSMNQMSSFHFKLIGDTLWFQAWTPDSPGTVAGACLGLFFLAIFERWIAAARATAEWSWNRSAQLAVSERPNRSKEPTHQKFPVNKHSHLILKSLSLRGGPFSPPFIPSHDIARGALQAVQTALTFLFMLAIMTFQIGFFISVSLGAGVGEMMFGRHIAAAMGH